MHLTILITLFREMNLKIQHFKVINNDDSRSRRNLDLDL
jgi:hypothetical protein